MTELLCVSSNPASNRFFCRTERLWRSEGNFLTVFLHCPLQLRVSTTPTEWIIVSSCQEVSAASTWCHLCLIRAGFWEKVAWWPHGDLVMAGSKTRYLLRALSKSSPLNSWLTHTPPPPTWEPGRAGKKGRNYRLRVTETCVPTWAGRWVHLQHRKAVKRSIITRLKQHLEQIVSPLHTHTHSLVRLVLGVKFYLFALKFLTWVDAGITTQLCVRVCVLTFSLIIACRFGCCCCCCCQLQLQSYNCSRSLQQQGPPSQVLCVRMCVCVWSGSEPVIRYEWTESFSPLAFFF